MSTSSQMQRPWRRRGLLATLSVCLALLSSTSAYDLQHEGHDLDIFERLALVGEIDIDTRSLSDLGRRQVGQDTSTTSEVASSPLSTPESTSTIQSQTTRTSTSVPSVTVVTTPLPVPFDSSVGTNFTTTSCPTFFNTFLSNSTFKSCAPVSLLLQNSLSFFQAERSAELLSATLDAACQAPLSICTPLMTSIASQLMDDKNCGADFRNQQPLVLQAYNGLVAYEPVYKATCLKDANTNEYCFTEAVTNSSNSDDVYPYYTAIGLNLPQGGDPTCNECLHQSMNIFAQYAVRKEQPLSSTYLGCASAVDGTCGAGFADVGVKVGSIKSGMGTQAAQMKSAGVAIERSYAIMSIAMIVGVLSLARS